MPFWNETPTKLGSRDWPFVLRIRAKGHTPPPQSPEPLEITNNATTMAPQSNAGGAGTSQSWTSPQAAAAGKLARLTNNATHLGFSNSPFFPKNLPEYMRHQSEYANDLTEREREKLGVKVGELEAKKKMEAEAREDQKDTAGVVREMKGERDGERKIGDVFEGEGMGVEKGLGDLRIIGEKQKEELNVRSYEELQEACAGKAKTVDDEVQYDVTESTEQIEGTESSEQVTPTKTKKKRKGHRGKGSKGKSKAEPKEDVKEEIKPTPETPTPKPIQAKPTFVSRRAANDARQKLLNIMAKDPMLQAHLAGTGKEPDTELWRAFTQTSMYNPNGSGGEVAAMFGTLSQPGLTPVLGAKTSIWAGDEHLKPEGKRDPKTEEHRAAWPELSEMKAEGQYRKEAGKDRRLPLPRKDLLNREAVIAAIGDTKGLTQEEIDDKVEALTKRTGDDIPWQDREVIRLEGFDRLESASKERREDEKRRRMKLPIPGPHSTNTGGQMGMNAGGMGAQMGPGGGMGNEGRGGANIGGQMGMGPQMGGMGLGNQHGQPQGLGHQNRGGANMALRGGHNNTRRFAQQPPLTPPKVVNAEAISYGADGPGDGKVPPPGGWVFDEEFLKTKGEWKELIEKHL